MVFFTHTLFRIYGNADKAFDAAFHRAGHKHDQHGRSECSKLSEMFFRYIWECPAHQLAKLRLFD